jgi:small subunit ribosomal protein S6
MRERRRDYEMMLIISPVKSSDEEINGVLDRIKTAITNGGGEVTAIESSAPWGRRKFAYPIRAYTEGEVSRRPFTEGFYVLIHAQLLTTKLAELERVLRLNESVLRYLVTLYEPKATPTAPPPQEAEPVVEAE